VADNFIDKGSIVAGSTSVSVILHLRAADDSGVETGKVAADCTGSYLRQGGSRTAITLADLSTVSSAYSAGGMKQLDGTNMPGDYRLDLPDAAVASGADWVRVYLKTSTGYAIESYALTTLAPVAGAVGDAVVETEGSITRQQAESLVLAILGGVTTSSGATVKDPSGAATRVVATINGSNERTSMTLTPSA